MKKILLPLLALITILFGLKNINLNQQVQELLSQNQVIEVVDGDSLTLNSRVKIRLANLDAPELGYCRGNEAKELLEKLVLNKKIRFTSIGHDQMGRTLALVYLGKTLVNEEILKAGLARYDGSPSPERKRLKKAYDYAFENKIGIHSPLCRAENPDKPNCLIKGNVEKHYNQKVYYFPGCANYQQTVVEKDLGDRWFCSEKEAETAGFQKSNNCYGKKYSLDK